MKRDPYARGQAVDVHGVERTAEPPNTDPHNRKLAKQFSVRANRRAARKHIDEDH